MLARLYGLPTRLPDWSASPLVAHPFAVSSEVPSQIDGDGVLWALHSGPMNGAMPGMPLCLLAPDNPPILGLIGDAIETDLVKRLAWREAHQKVALACTASESGPRKPGHLDRTKSPGGPASASTRSRTRIRLRRSLRWRDSEPGTGHARRHPARPRKAALLCHQPDWRQGIGHAHAPRLAAERDHRVIQSPGGDNSTRAPAGLPLHVPLTQ